MAESRGPSVSIRRAGRNYLGMRVLAARCSCGWAHMTAYRLTRRRRAHYYLLDRANEHVSEQHARGSQQASAPSSGSGD